MNILYLAVSSFPGENAYATRIDGITKALLKCNNNVTVLTDYSDNMVGKQKVGLITVYSTAKHIHSERSYMDRILAYPRMMYLLKKLINDNHFDCVIMSSIYLRADAIIRYLHSVNLPIILESCEWFDHYNWKHGKYDWEFKKYKKAWTNSFVKADGVIGISRLLVDHYQEHTPHVFRLPTILDVKNSNNTINAINGKSISFVGTISWGKDRLIEIILALASYDCNDIVLNIYGPSLQQVEKQLLAEGINIDILNNPNIIIHGRVPHSQINDICRESSFGLIIRPDRKQSHAGFPTKLAEYMSCGTPVIANDTGDIGLFLKDGYNGFLLPRVVTVEDILDVLKTISNLSSTDYIRLRAEARRTAELYFDISTYSDELNDFILKVVQGYHKQS